MINSNGNIIQSESITTKSRAFLYGDAVFTIVKYTNGHLIFWEDHYLRLMASMRIVRMNIPDNFTMEFLENEVKKLVTFEQKENASLLIRISVERASGGTYTPTNENVNYFIEIQQETFPFYRSEFGNYEVELYKDFYVQPQLLSTLKTNNRLLCVMGSVFAQENEYQNCILLNNQKNVVGFLNGNLFLVQGNIVKTPPLSDGCINGITRKKVIQILQKMEGILVEEVSISPFDLQKADELFLTNTENGIQSIFKYKRKNFVNYLTNRALHNLNILASERK